VATENYTEETQHLPQSNLAKGLNPERLKKIGRDAVAGFNADEDSRSEWLERNKEFNKLAAQVVEVKNYPWPNASNVKYPLLTTAVGAFAARAYPAMVPGPELVKGLVIGRDRSGESAEKARRIGMHMSYQLLCQIPNWEDDHDRMGYVCGLVGNAFKKTYFNHKLKKIVSELVLPKDLVVHYLSKSIESAPRKTHVLLYSKNDIESMRRRGMFLGTELGKPETKEKYEDQPEVLGISPSSSDDAHSAFTILEQHTLLDLDEDGYEEPVIIWVEKESEEVLRIEARNDLEDVEKNEGSEVVNIEPTEMFTNYVFVPDMESGVYGFGLGSMIGPINDAGNTLINQLIDAGKLSNLQSGFIGKGTKLTSGVTMFRPGEWKQAMVSGDDLRKGIFPLPTREPSNVLMNLFQILIGSGEKAGSVTNIFSGELPGQNTPATVVMTAVDQGGKVFNSIYKRLHRSFTKELKKIFRLNSDHMPDHEYFNPQNQTSDQPELVFRGDYDRKAYDVVPTADPNVSSDAQQLARAQADGHDQPSDCNPANP